MTQVCHCGTRHLSLDYLCSDCREEFDGQDHPLAGKTVTSVTDYGDMRGTKIRFDDGTMFIALYVRTESKEES